MAFFFLLACKKEVMDVNTVVGIYHGTKTTGSSVSPDTGLGVEEKGATKDAILIKNVLEYPASGYFYERNKFAIPDHIYTHNAIYAGGGCTSGCETYPFLVKFNGFGEFTGYGLNITVHEYRKYVGQENFGFFMDTYYVLQKQ